MAGPGSARNRGAAPQRVTLRLDKWLWQARFFKTRALATALVEEGHLRINGQPTRKPGYGVAEGDVLTFPQAARIRVVRITALGQRRGPAEEARMLYLDLDTQEAGPDPADPLE